MLTTANNKKKKAKKKKGPPQMTIKDNDKLDQIRAARNCELFHYKLLVGC